jgi:hypothetical protein
VAGVAVFETFPFALAGVPFGVAFGVDAAGFFVTASVRLGLFLVAKNSDVVVSSSSGEGSFFAFLGAGFFGVAFLGLPIVSIRPVYLNGSSHFTTSASSSSSESSTTRLAREGFFGAAFLGAGFCRLVLDLGAPRVRPP